jgi:hypothetical protein
VKPGGSGVAANPSAGDGSPRSTATGGVGHAGEGRPQRKRGNGGDGGELNSPSRNLRRRPLRACSMICRRSPGRPSTACRALQSRPLSGFDSDYATLLGIAPPLNDASTAHGGEAASTFTLLPKQRGRKQTGCCQLLRLPPVLRGLTAPRLAFSGNRPLSKPRIPTEPAHRRPRIVQPPPEYATGRLGGRRNGRRVSEGRRASARWAAGDGRWPGGAACAAGHPARSTRSGAASGRRLSWPAPACRRVPHRVPVTLARASAPRTAARRRSRAGR